MELHEYKKFEDIDCSSEGKKSLPDFNIDSDGEPPEDDIGDVMNVVKKQVTKEIMTVGEGMEKPGKPYIVRCLVKAYFEENKSDGDEDTIYSNPDPIFLTLGDLRLPLGLWRSIEHMKKGEKSKIVIKPESGFNPEKDFHKETLQIPSLIKDDPAKIERLRSEVIVYEVEVLDWTIKVDIIGDGHLMKTVT